MSTISRMYAKPVESRLIGKDAFRPGMTVRIVGAFETGAGVQHVGVDEDGKLLVVPLDSRSPWNVVT